MTQMRAPVTFGQIRVEVRKVGRWKHEVVVRDNVFQRDSWFVYGEQSARRSADRALAKWQRKHAPKPVVYSTGGGRDA